MPDRADGMDDDALVENDLECAVCLALLCEPVEWPGACNHSFCRLCLLRLHTLAAFRCPMCRCPCSSPSTTVTLAEISRWPVAYERRCPAKGHEYDHNKPSSHPTTRAPTVRRARARAAAKAMGCLVMGTDDATLMPKGKRPRCCQPHESKTPSRAFSRAERGFETVFAGDA